MTDETGSELSIDSGGSASTIGEVDLEKGAKFLHERDRKLHITDPVEHEQKRRRKRGEKISQRPAVKLEDWMNLLERIHMREGGAESVIRSRGGDGDIRLDRPGDSELVRQRLREYYHDQHVIKPEEVPERYFEAFNIAARERGFGGWVLPDETREELADILIDDQKVTLDYWLDYFMSDESKSIPMWIKYWAFTGMVKLSSYDKSRKRFGNRVKGTVAPFPELNKEALAYVRDAVYDRVRLGRPEGVTEDPELVKLLRGSNFGKLYAHALEEIVPTEDWEKSSSEGVWVQYPRGVDPMEHVPEGFDQPLTPSLVGRGTGWCTAGVATARSQLQQGDFYVYYSKSREGKYELPRAAIRMEGWQIAEVSGVDAGQRLDLGVEQIVYDKLGEFGNVGELYLRQVEKMKMMTEIERKHNDGEELTKDELKVLYEIDEYTYGFADYRDPRVFEIRAERNAREDIMIAMDLSSEQISLTTQEFLEGDEIVYHYGDLDLGHLSNLGNKKLPQRVIGDLILSGLSSCEGLEMPFYVEGRVDLTGMTEAFGLKLPEHVWGVIDMRYVRWVNDLTLPKVMGGSINLSNLLCVRLPEMDKLGDDDLDLIESRLPDGMDIEDLYKQISPDNELVFPKDMGSDIRFENMQWAEGIKFPESMSGTLEIPWLRSLSGVELPRYVGGDFIVTELVLIDGVKLPEEIGGQVDMRNVLLIKNSEFPKRVNNTVKLSRLLLVRVPKDLSEVEVKMIESRLPESWGWGANELREYLGESNELVLSQVVKGHLELNNLLFADGLRLPLDYVGSHLVLESLIRAGGLVLPRYVEWGDVRMGSLTSAEGAQMSEYVGGSLDLGHVILGEGLVLPKGVGGDIYLERMISASGMQMSEYVGGDIYLERLRSRDGLESPEEFGGGFYMPDDL